MTGRRARIIVVSDGVAAGSRPDRSGRALSETLTRAGFEIAGVRVIPDGIAPVAAEILEAARDFSGLIVTTGGTGFGPRDLTPEGTRRVLEREAPGLGEAMRLVDPLGRLSRGVAGTIGEALVLNVPGSASGAVACLEAVLDVVPDALDLLSGVQRHRDRV